MPVTAGHWDELCAAIDRPDLLVDECFAAMPSRLKNHEILCEEISNWTRQRTKDEAMQRLGAAGVPCSACFDTRELHDDPHLDARDYVKTVDHPELGGVRVLGFARRLSASPVAVERAPLLGCALRAGCRQYGCHGAWRRGQDGSN